MTSNREHNESSESIIDEPISDTNTDEAPSVDVDPNEFLRQSSQYSSESNDSGSEEFQVSNSGININGTMFMFLSEFRAVFDKLFFFTKFAIESPFIPESILRKHLNFRNRFIEHKRIREYMEPITSTQRIVTHILSIMPAPLKQTLTRKMLTKDLAQRPKPGPSQYSALRPRSWGGSSEELVWDFFSEWQPSDSVRSSSIYSEDEFAGLRTRAEVLQVKCPKTMIGNLTYKVLSDLENIKDIADVTLRQYESGDGLDLVTTTDYLVGYEAMKKGYGANEEIFEYLALMVANDCEKHLQSTFKILDLRNLINLYEKSRSVIHYAIFLLKIHQKIDTEVKDISKNIKSTVRVARNLVWTKENRGQVQNGMKI